MKTNHTIPELLSGQFDEELRVLVAGKRGITNCENDPDHPEDLNGWTGYRDGNIVSVPPFSTSLDACRELLADLTEEEEENFNKELCKLLFGPTDYYEPVFKLAIIILRATARQICVAYLIVKGILK